MTEPKMKKCNTCQNIFIVNDENFYRVKNKFKTNDCKICKCKKVKDYRDNNPSYQLVLQKLYEKRRTTKTLLQQRKQELIQKNKLNA